MKEGGRRWPPGRAALAMVAAVGAFLAAGVPPGTARVPAGGAEASSRPTTGRGEFGYSVPEHSPPHCTAHFCVHWVDSTADAPKPVDSDGDGIPDHVERVATAAERSHQVENVELGWVDPRRDGNRGGDGRTDFYIADFNGRALGVAIPEPGRARRGSAAFLVVEDDFSRREYPGSNAYNLLLATVAHEYNHVLQLAHTLFVDLWLGEGTATWIQDQVFPEKNDYLRHVKRWRRRSTMPITFPDPRKAYGAAVWNRWLAARYGPDVVRETWERLGRVRPRDLATAAYDSAIRASGESSFSREFARFAAATAEWRSLPGFSPDGRKFGDVFRRGSLRPGEELERKLDHTAYALLDVPPQGGRALALAARSQRGAAAGFALVGRRGSDIGGEVDVVFGYAPEGGARRLVLPRPGSYDRITAVLVNADATPTNIVSDREGLLYKHDDVPFEARLHLRP